jgi:16S rRNA (guanine527-N7)-methyltransferase
MTPEQAAGLFGRNGLELGEETVRALIAYERLLRGWNEKINLVSRRDTSDVFTKQILGSVSFLFRYTLAGGSTLLDVGTGGGLPGIPLAIIHPDIRVTMIDSIQKKARAVEEMVGALGLDNARMLCGRVEELSPGKTGTFDYVIARGVSTASEIVRWCGRLLRRPGRGRPPEQGVDAGVRKPVPPGSFILLKGGDLTAELASLSEVAGSASVTVRSLEVDGARDLFTEKKVIIVTP